jgi:hypothetical protein
LSLLRMTTQAFRFNPKAPLGKAVQAARALGERLEALAVVLFGSLARGEATPTPPEHPSPLSRKARALPPGRGAPGGTPWPRPGRP